MSLKEDGSFHVLIGDEAIVCEPDFINDSQSILSLIQMFVRKSRDTTFYLTDRAKSIQAIRNYLRKEGVSAKKILNEVLIDSKVRENQK